MTKLTAIATTVLMIVGLLLTYAPVPVAAYSSPCGDNVRMIRIFKDSDTGSYHKDICEYNWNDYTLHSAGTQCSNGVDYGSWNDCVSAFQIWGVGGTVCVAFFKDIHYNGDRTIKCGTGVTPSTYWMGNGAWNDVISSHKWCYFPSNDPDCL